MAVDGLPPQGKFRVIVEARPRAGLDLLDHGDTFHLLSWPNVEQPKPVDDRPQGIADERLYRLDTGQLAYAVGSSYPLEELPGLCRHDERGRPIHQSLKPPRQGVVMQVKLGNVKPKFSVFPEIGDAPGVTTINIPDPFEDARGWNYDFDPAHDLAASRAHIEAACSAYRTPDKFGITRMADLGHGNQEAYLSVVHANGAWMTNAQQDPSWVWSDNPGFAQMLAEHYGCPLFDDAALRAAAATHWTRLGNKLFAPGASPELDPDYSGVIVDSGRLLQSNMMGGGLIGIVGAGTAATSNSLTSAAITTVTANKYAGMRIYVYSTTGVAIVWGNIVSHTSGTTPVFTVDQWYTETGAAVAQGTTPTTPWGYIITGGSISCWYMGLTTNTVTPAHTDTSLASEYSTAAGGLYRKISPYANTSSVSPVTWTLTPVYTANGSDAGLPLTFAKIGTFPSIQVGDVTDTLMGEALLSATATIAASGDQLTVTDTWTGS